MKKLLFILLLSFALLPAHLLAGELKVAMDKNADAISAEVKTVHSPKNRVAVLELYTSEGCSSCPPADRFMSQLKDSGISNRQLIPMAFHVTYWDYIGWKDRFAKKQFDQRQREQAAIHNSSSIYTPQFLLSGEDYRHYASFSDDINKLVNQKALINLMLSASVEKNVQGEEILHLAVNTDIINTDYSNADVGKTGIYFVVLENNLSSNVNDGENEGETLHHDFVVRQMSGPHFQKKSEAQQSLKQIIKVQPEWKKQDLSIVVFAENLSTGEVLQAVRLDQPGSK
jgi:hypothetical protein